MCRWIEACLVHADGDFYGQPFRLTPEQRLLIWRMYELTPAGGRRYRRVLLGRAKGYGKTELDAALALAEFAGPVAPIAPDIPVAASSFEQADRVFGAAKVMASEGALSRYVDVYDTEMLLLGKPGRLYRVAAAAGANDGGRHTFRVADEVHEFVGQRERVHLVLTNGLTKRKGCALDSSTAGDDVETSLLGRLYTKGKKIERGELRDDRFLFDWIEHPDPECDLGTEEKVWEAVRIAYRGAGDHVDLEEIVARFYEIPEFEFRRYYLNQFTAGEKAWLPTGAWARCARKGKDGQPPPWPRRGTRIVLGFDGSYNNDATVLVGCTLEEQPYLFVVGCWERPPKAPDTWVVPRDEVSATVHMAMERWKVKELAGDPPGWKRELGEWADRYGHDVVVAFQTWKPALMAPACAKLYSAVVNDGVEHDGDPRTAKHLANAVIRESPAGTYIGKEHRDSPKKVDLGTGHVIAFDRATQHRRASVYQRRGLLTLGGDDEQDDDD